MKVHQNGFRGGQQKTWDDTAYLLRAALKRDVLSAVPEDRTASNGLKL